MSAAACALRGTERGRRPRRGRAARRSWIVLALGAAFAVGCAHPHEDLPTYAWTDDATALRDLRARAAAMRTLSSEARLTLTRPDGQSVQLDGAIALSLPGHSVRLRAWKFNQAVFDLTLTPAGLWIETPHDPASRRRAFPASASAAQMAQALALIGGDAFEGPGVQVRGAGGPTFRVIHPVGQGQTMTVLVDRRTLVVRAYHLSDPAGRVRFTLVPADYRVLAGVTFPTRFTAESAFGQIDVVLVDPELNDPLPPGAFVPPRGAEKAP